MDEQRGRKVLTTANFLEPDKTSTILVDVMRATGEVRHPTALDWAERFLAVSLDDEVPHEIQDLFEAARGAMLYGFYYYPLYALAEDQLFRVADSAILHRYLEAGGKLRTKTRYSVVDGGDVDVEEAPPFAGRLRFLVKRGIVNEQDEPWWSNMWDMRNITSHSRFSRLGPQTDALRTLKSVAARVSDLYGPE